jgi:hypothetical protein
MAAAESAAAGELGSLDELPETVDDDLSRCVKHIARC